MCIYHVQKTSLLRLFVLWLPGRQVPRRQGASQNFEVLLRVEGCKGQAD